MAENVVVEKLILDALPRTFNSLQAIGVERGIEWREIDRALQRLRKRGKIVWRRNGRKITWHAIGDAA